MPVSMKDVATAAGVSLSTVSRALADSPRIKPETRTHIQQLAKEMGYLPNAIARGLATHRTFVLGVVVMDITDPLIVEIVRGIDHAAQGHGYSVILSDCGPDPERQLEAIQLLRQQRVDSIIVPDPIIGDSALPALLETGAPVVLINRPQYRYSINTDNVAGARQAVSYLLDLGHRRIAYIGANRNPAESHERLTGYLEALAAYGLMSDTEFQVGPNDWSENGWQAMQALLTLSQPPTALFCFNDMTAIGALGAAHAAGVRVPEELSVVGFDDINLAAHFIPPLTTVAQQKERLAELAVSLALALIDDDAALAGQLIPANLVVRGSTAARPSKR
jgi:DNA-binding LacI/PurR family transcriptional regulator